MTAHMKKLAWIGLGALLWLNLSALATAGEKSSRVPLPQVNVKKGEKCVEPKEVMRRNHMNFILHQRDETMHKGIRTKQYSLKNCVNCHADPKTHSVLGKDGFCQSCHKYAAVNIDCFSCHTASAEERARALTKQELQHPGDDSGVHLVDLTANNKK